MKRKNIALLACLFLAFLPWNLRAQEFSYTIGSSTWGQLKNGYSIVREIDINRHMVFTFYEGRMTFSLVDENLLTVSNFEVGTTYIATGITDFEIVDDTVFYCGQRGGRGLVGKFCYTDNPTTYYEYFPADEYDVKHFSRLDV